MLWGGTAVLSPEAILASGRGMDHCKSTRIVLVVGNDDFYNKLKDALADTTFALVQASTKHEAMKLLELLRAEIDIAIIELELANYHGWDLIRHLNLPPEMPGKFIATTSLYPELISRQVEELGVDA